MVSKNKYHSFNTGTLPLGCKLCVKGEKLVLFVTGVCPRACYFCPVSDEKIRKDCTFANEQEIISDEEVIREAENMNAKGAGITGGDPLARIDRTCHYIKILKKRFGKKFHIHLYTSLNLVNNERLSLLHKAGLDEIRFHPDLDSKKLWNNLNYAKEYDWDTGVEIPLIPGKEKETMSLIDFVQDKVDFLNLNELEIADNSSSKLSEMGFNVKSKLSYAIKGSLELGLTLIKYAKKQKVSIPIHACTAKLKDSIQLTNRIKRQGFNVKRSFDEVDSEGLLTRGALYLPELQPGFGYRKKLKQIDKNHFLNKLNPLLGKIKNRLKINSKFILIDEKKPRILILKSYVLKHKKYFISIGLVPAIVKEYPTADQLEMEVEILA
ncbi:MAG: radical SAM protein [Nanoarchaeota archaeon]